MRVFVKTVDLQQSSSKRAVTFYFSLWGRAPFWFCGARVLLRKNVRA